MIPIRAERKGRGWTVHAMARKLRDAADDPQEIPHLESLRPMIHRWERGGTVSERYRYLYCRVLGRTEFELFGVESPEIITESSGKSTPFADISGNSYVVLALPPGTQRIVIDVTGADTDEESAVPQPVRRLMLVGE